MVSLELLFPFLFSKKKKKKKTEKKASMVFNGLNAGPIVRIGPNKLSFSTDTALNTIYGPKKVNVRKSDFYKAIDGAAGEGVAQSTFSESDKSKHAVRRRLLGHAFSDSAIRSSEQYILQNVTKCCSLLGPRQGDEWSEKRNMHVWATWLAYDIMGDLMFGKSFNCLEEDEYRHLPRSITDGTKFANWVSTIHR